MGSGLRALTASTIFWCICAYIESTRKTPSLPTDTAMLPCAGPPVSTYSLSADLDRLQFELFEVDVLLCSGVPDAAGEDQGQRECQLSSSANRHACPPTAQGYTKLKLTLMAEVRMVCGHREQRHGGP